MDPKISHIQLRGLLVSMIIGVGVLTMPVPLVEHMGSDGWAAILIVGLMSALVFTIYYNIFRLYPNKDFFEIGRLTVGKPIFNIFIVFYIIHYLTLLALISRNLGELVKIFLLQTTPLEIIILTFILASTYLASYEIDKVSRAGYFVYPIIIIFTAAITLIALPGADFTNILPVFQSDIGGFISGSREIIFSFMGLEILFLAIPFVEQKDKVFKTGIYAIVTVTLIYLVSFLMVLTNFSQKQILLQNYPILILIRQLDIPWLFLENLDGLVLALWIIVVFATMAPGYFAMGKYASKLFKTKSHKYFVLGAVPIIYFIAMMPENFIELMEDLSNFFNALATITAIIIPLIILIVGLIRKKVEK